jgi:hypothetical protein
MKPPMQIGHKAGIEPPTPLDVKSTHIDHNQQSSQSFNSNLHKTADENAAKNLDENLNENSIETSDEDDFTLGESNMDSEEISTDCSSETSVDRFSGVYLWLRLSLVSLMSLILTVVIGSHFLRTERHHCTNEFGNKSASAGTRQAELCD